MNENDLEEILNKITQLASKISVAKVDSEAEANHAKSIELIRSVEKSNMLASDLLSNLNNTSMILETESNKKDAIQKNLEEFENSNNNIQLEVDSVSFIYSK